MKNIKDLKYPDVIHIESYKIYNKIKPFISTKKIYDYDPRYKYYLIGGGYSMHKESYKDYNNKYNILEPEDLIIDEEYQIGFNPDLENKTVNVEKFPFDIEIITREPSYWYKIGQKYTIYASDIKNGELVYFNHPTIRNYWISARNTKIISEITQANNEVINEFKAGDWAVLEIYDFITNHSKIKTVGEVFQVKGIYPCTLPDYPNTQWLNTTTTSSDSILSKNCRKAFPHEIPTTSNDSINLSSLPEKWCVKSNSSTRTELFNFVVSKGYTRTQPKTDFYFHYPFLAGGGSLYNKIQYGYTEITYGQFKKWVLQNQSHKEPTINKTNEEVEVPDYVECISTDRFDKGPVMYTNLFKVGEIYKWSDLCDGTIGNLNYDFSVWNGTFIKSTKEDYTFQKVLNSHSFENSTKNNYSKKKTKFNEQEFLSSSFNKKLKLNKTNKTKVKQSIKF